MSVHCMGGLLRSQPSRMLVDDRSVTRRQVRAVNKWNMAGKGVGLFYLIPGAAVSAPFPVVRNRHCMRQSSVPLDGDSALYMAARIEVARRTG